MKKLIGLAAAVSLAFGMFVSPNLASANESTNEEEPSEVTTNFIQVTGKIVDIEDRDGTPALVVETAPDNITIFPITEEVKHLYNRSGEAIERSNLKVGMDVDVYYDRNMAIALIYPAVIVPSIVVADDQEVGQVKVAKFNENLVSLDHELVLHIGEETEVINEQGETISADDLKGNELIVFYNVSTKSIPAQTTPTKVIALTKSDENENENGSDSKQREAIANIIANDHYMKGNTKMIPLRKIAEELGYEIEWNQASKTATMTLQNRSFLITVGEKAYGYNRSLRQFDVAPELKAYTMYVSEDLIDVLID